MENSIQKVPKRILNSLISSISAGVVPRMGAPYIAIGRTDEINAILSDLNFAEEGGGGIRFLIGRYGSGKSFLLQLIRGYAIDRGFLTADTDLTPERRLYGTQGSGLSTYRELLRNLASKAYPEGGALNSILSRWMLSVQDSLAEKAITSDMPNYSFLVQQSIKTQIKGLEDMVGGFDFTKILSTYFQASLDDNEDVKSAALRWLRGEYANKTEARSALGFNVFSVIDDSNWYDYIKLWSKLSRTIGYKGLVVFIDECVNLYKIPNRTSRENNYEKILSIFNDVLQGHAEGLEVIFGGTPQFLEDTRRGLFSYEALKSRLCDSKFEDTSYKNMLGPVIRLKRLSNDELLALLQRITKFYQQYYNWEPRITQEQMVKFLELCLSRIGGENMLTPREMLRDYMGLLNILLQNDNATFETIVEKCITLSDEDSKKAFETIQENTEESKNEQTKRYTLDDLSF